MSLSRYVTMACLGCFAACNDETPVPHPTREPGSSTGKFFTEVTSQAGLNYAHGLLSPEPKQAESISGGVAAGDYDGDGWIDLYVVRGTIGPNLLFRNLRNGTFEETAVELGIDDTGQGRGIVCFDYDRDGDVDIYIANNNQPPRLYRNDRGNNGNFLDIRLRGLPPNTEAIGARILIDVDGRKQMRELRAGCNFVSQNPAEAHFGVADASLIDEMLIVWPDGQRMTLTNIDANRYLTVFHPSR